MTVFKYILYLLISIFLFVAVGIVILQQGFFSESLGPGKILGKIKNHVLIL